MGWKSPYCPLSIEPEKILCTFVTKYSWGLPALQQGFDLMKEEQRAQRGVRGFEDQIALDVSSKSQVRYGIVWFSALL